MMQSSVIDLEKVECAVIARPSGPADEIVGGAATKPACHVLNPLVLLDVSPDRHPVLVYLARLAPGSRRTMRQALENIADCFGAGNFDANSLPWHQLRYEHTTAIRSELAQRC